MSVTQEPLFSVVMPTEPEHTVSRNGAVETHQLSAVSGRQSFAVTYSAPAAGWESDPAVVLDDMRRALISSSGVHVRSDETSNDGRSAMLVLDIDPQNEFAPLPEPGTAACRLVVFADYSLLVFVIGPRQPTQTEQEHQDRFLGSLQDAPGRFE